MFSIGDRKVFENAEENLPVLTHRYSTKFQCNSTVRFSVIKDLTRISNWVRSDHILLSLLKYLLHLCKLHVYTDITFNVISFCGTSDIYSIKLIEFKFQIMKKSQIYSKEKNIKDFPTMFRFPTIRLLLTLYLFVLQLNQ